MEQIFISLGLGCQVATQIKDAGFRQFSLPFDWVVPYSGVSSIIKNNFCNYIPNGIFTNSNNDSHPVSLETHTIFPHNKFPQDTEKMKRRINRFIDLLNSTDKELIFIKRGHMDQHHNAECLIKYNWNICNDIDECKEIFIFLKNKYPNLKFKIILLLLCSKCFDVNTNYICENIEIHNVSNANTSFQEKDLIAQNKLNDILLKFK